ncbi:hypothetical protein [Lyngbya sp. CCY1209]|uniref:hypothetical protein n=1 Tax=Lyngbya sp. CCY1209 TaxID=2886103 RepID=UPI002D2147A4|nr:hypothetical protein [Lyngbya sp. CCY1209]MEB3885230.1 hypothetical protein [Lyngbya sp. CCY1209]
MNAQEKARLLMSGSRRRSQHRQSSMFSRLTEELGSSVAPTSRRQSNPDDLQ